MTIAALLADCPALRYHAAGSASERHEAREECCRRYGQTDIDRGRMWMHVREELGRLRALDEAPPSR